MHRAIIAKIDQIIEIPGAESIQIAKVLGESVIVSKDMGVGYVGVFFPVDLQLSEDYCRENNLFRDSTKNKDTTKKGFFEESRRVRAQPFMKVKSEGYFAPTSSLYYLMSKDGTYTYDLGYEFDEIHGQKVCEKYISPSAKVAIANALKNGKQKKSKEVPNFVKHVDSNHFRHSTGLIPVGALLSFHAKVHGTSFRVAKTEVVRPITSFWGKVNAFMTGKPFETHKMEYVVGTRNVILPDASKEGFHGSEAYRFEVLEALKPYLTDGMTIYGEIAGYVNGASVMPKHDMKVLKDKTYTKKYGNEVVYRYGCKDHEYRFHVYRITRQDLSGNLIDMSQKQMEAWCDARAIQTTFEVHPQIIFDGDYEKLNALVDSLTERPEVLTEDYIDPSHISEGIIIRVDSDGDTPKFYKSKSYAFRCLEGHVDALDIETVS